MEGNRCLGLCLRPTLRLNSRPDGDSFVGAWLRLARRGNSIRE